MKEKKSKGCQVERFTKTVSRKPMALVVGVCQSKYIWVFNG